MGIASTIAKTHHRGAIFEQVPGQVPAGSNVGIASTIATTHHRGCIFEQVPGQVLTGSYSKTIAT